MIPCLLFLNELSYSYDGERTSAQILPVLLSTLNAIKAAHRIRNDLVVAGSSSISKISIGDGSHSVASLLSGNYYKEEWRFIRGLDQASPGTDAWNLAPLDPMREVTYGGRSTFGLLWAATKASMVFSLALAPDWEANIIAAQIEEIGLDDEIADTPVNVPNASNPDHANDHRELIAKYGKDESASSIVYQDDDFVARIYFFDHNPPHFHVCSPGEPAETLATIAINSLDTLTGKLTGRMQRSVRAWAQSHRAPLMENWNRCRTGAHPFQIEA